MYALQQTVGPALVLLAAVDRESTTCSFDPTTTVVRTSGTSATTFQPTTFTTLCTTVGVEARRRTTRATADDVRWC